MDESLQNEIATASCESIPNVFQNLVSGNAGAPDLQSSKQTMCEHMVDGDDCKDGDAGAARSQFLNHVRYKWKLKLLLFYNALAAILLSSLFWPVTKEYWEVVDVACFKCLNGSLEGRPYWQVFWALANHKLADWVEDLFILGFFIAYVRSAHKALRLRKIGEFVFCALYIAAIIFFINRILFRENLSIPRLSPTLVVDSSIRLSEQIPWMKIKDVASKSFPGDHGTTAILFAASFSYFASRRLSILACIYGAFLCIPRLITGAHWLSDVVVGSGSIAIVFLSWAFCTPLFVSFVNGWERLFSIRKNKKRELSQQ